MRVGRWSARAWVPALAVLAAAGLLGTALGQDAGDDQAAPEVLQFSAEISDLNSLIAWVTVSLSGEARVQIEYGNEGAGRFRTRLSEPAVNHYIPVARLRAETAYQYAIGVEGPDGEVVFRADDEGEFTTRALPELLQRHSHQASGRSTQQLILGDFQLHLVFWDDDGRIVWYYEAPEQTPGIGAVKQTPEGNLRWEAWRCCLREVSPLAMQVGEIAFDAEQEPFIPHHDYWVLDDGRILSLAEGSVEFANPADPEGDPVRVTTDAIVAWDPASGNPERVWEALDVWEVDLPGPDEEEASWEWQVGWDENHFRWMHVNSIQIRPRGNVILSIRNQRKIVSLSPDLQAIEWELGGVGGDFAFPDPSDQFYAQHAATELPNGNILTFDNGFLRPEAEGGQYSRALELRLDEQAGTAVKAWEHRADPDLFVSHFGSAYRLRNGNTLVNYGVTPQATDVHWDEQTPILLIEADEAGDEVFRLETWGAIAPSRYRAYGDIDSIMGEVRLPSAERPEPGGACSADEALCVRTIPQPPADSAEAEIERSSAGDGARFRLPAGGAIHGLNLGSLPLDREGRTFEPMRLCLPTGGSAPVAMPARYSAADGRWELLQGAAGDPGGGICGLVDRSGRYALLETDSLGAGLDAVRAGSPAIWRAGTMTTASELLGALAGEGVRALYRRDGAGWRGYAALPSGRLVPGARDFPIEPGANLWLGN